jgi:hypothetical protein
LNKDAGILPNLVDGEEGNRSEIFKHSGGYIMLCVIVTIKDWGVFQDKKKT